MVTFESDTARYLIYGILAVAGLVLLFAGYRIGKLFASLGAQRAIEKTQSDLFTTQQGFKKLYETEIATLKQENAALSTQVVSLEARVEEYRKKAAGFGGLFNSGNKKSDAMYALLLENEALEEQLHKQNQKLSIERKDAVQESLRNNGYRRVLMSQLMNDSRIKGYVQEMLDDDRQLPAAHNAEQRKLPDDSQIPSA